MTRWMQDRPSELVEGLRRWSHVDLRPEGAHDVARAQMFAAADMIEREIIGRERSPLHYRMRDCWRDAWDCLRGRAFIVRRRSDAAKSWQWPPPLGTVS
jgi:hypothetical protein